MADGAGMAELGLLAASCQTIRRSATQIRGGATWAAMSVATCWARLRTGTGFALKLCTVAAGLAVRAAVGSGTMAAEARA